jgi:putative transposase
MQKWRKWEAAEESDWLMALKRESVLSPLATQSRPGAQRVEEAALELGLRRSVVYDLLKRYRQRSQTSSLLPGKRGREPKVAVLDRDREQLLSSIQRRFAEKQLPAPNYRTVVRRIEALETTSELWPALLSRSLNSALDQYERGKLRFSPFRSTFFRPGLKYINTNEFRDLSAVNEVRT